jgi:virginiamycin A acetyltransferase
METDDMQHDDHSRPGPDPNQLYPIEGVKRVCFLKNVVRNPNIIVGDYTYYDDPDHPESFENNVLYHYDFIGDRLIIRKFCAIASGVTFIMNGANHKLRAFTTYLSVR